MTETRTTIATDAEDARGGAEMTYRLIIKGRLPGLNEYIDECRSSPHKGNRMKQTEQEAIEWAIRQQMRGVRITRPVRLIYKFIEPNMKRDQDNVSSFARKVIQDALVKSGVLFNDGWKQVCGSEESFDVDKDDPRIIVIIEEVERWSIAIATKSRNRCGG